MSLKTDYAASEWDVLLKAPMFAGWAVIAASPNGPIGMIKEAGAMGGVARDAVKQAPDNSLLKALVTDMGSFGEMMQRREKVEVDGIKARALDLCKQALAIVNAKGTPDEAKGYKQWLLSVGQKVAEASKEGGFLGFGGVQVSENEALVVKELAAAIGASA
jgi:hypothetical protein